MGKIWTGEERSGEQQAAGQVETPACQTLLRGQTLIGHDGRLMRGNSAQGGSQLILNSSFGLASSKVSLCLRQEHYWFKVHNLASVFVTGGGCWCTYWFWNNIYCQASAWEYK